MAQGVRTISIRFLGDTKDLQRASQQAGQQLDGWRSKLEKLNQVAVGAAMAIGAGAIAIGKDLVSLASPARSEERRVGKGGREGGSPAAGERQRARGG